jgi:hypothetical protein
VRLHEARVRVGHPQHSALRLLSHACELVPREHDERAEHRVEAAPRRPGRAIDHGATGARVDGAEHIGFHLRARARDAVQRDAIREVRVGRDPRVGAQAAAPLRPALGIFHHVHPVEVHVV